MKKFLILCLTLSTVIGVAACGKKPGFVTAPQGEKADQYPHTYPPPTPPLSKSAQNP